MVAPDLSGGGVVPGDAAVCWWYGRADDMATRQTVRTARQSAEWAFALHDKTGLPTAGPKGCQGAAQLPSRANARGWSQPVERNPAAMLRTPASRSRLIARLRKQAITCGPLAVRT